MGYFISEDGSYHEGDALPGDVAVPRRPSHLYQWANGAWVYAASETDYVMAVQAVLDAKARERNYDDIATAASYAGDPDATFNAEGTALRAWRSTVWRFCYQQLAKVQSEQMAQPSIAAFVATLPAFTWPD